jgi:hypothetical protein
VFLTRTPASLTLERTAIFAKTNAGGITALE